MQVGSLVNHIEWGCTGIVLRQGVSTCDKWLIQFSDGTFTHTITQSRWCTECELEVICK